MLYNHERDGDIFQKGERSHYLPIGKWTNIRKDNGQLIATAEFDDSDEFAQKIKGKVENGYLNGVSIGFNVLAVSEEEGDMVAGQTRPTVTQSELMEVSIVDIPGNRNAVKLYFPKKNLTLKGNESEETINSVLPRQDQNQTVHMELQQIAKQLGHSNPKKATEQEVNQMLTDLQNQAASASEGGEHEQATDKIVNQILAIGKQKSLITDVNEESMKKMAKADPDAALEFISGQEKQEEGGKQQDNKELSLNDLVAELKKQNGKDEGAGEWDWATWQEKDRQGLYELATTNPEKFKKLFKGHYGFEPDLG